MFLSYFVVDEERQLQRVSRTAVEGLWHCERRADALAVRVGDELRLVTALCEEDLTPVVCYFVRLELRGGEITLRSRYEAFEAMTARSRRKYDHPAARRQFEGWPSDWQRQMAVALDVPATDLCRLGLGGPLLMSDLWGVPLDKVLAYFEEACGE